MCVGRDRAEPQWRDRLLRVETIDRLYRRLRNMRCRIASSACCRAAARRSSVQPTSPSSRRNSRTDSSSHCRFLPFNATFAFPSGVRGPVENRQGWCFSAVCLNFSRPAGVSPFRFRRFRRFASLRRWLQIPFVVECILESPRLLSVWCWRASFCRWLDHFRWTASCHSMPRCRWPNRFR